MFRIHLALAAMAALMLSFAAPAMGAKLTISGDVTYRERIALPAGATLSVALVDLAAPETEGISATAPIAARGQVPLTFTLNVDESLLETGRSYGLVARIVAEDGAVWFRNAEPYPLDLPDLATPILITVGFAGRVETPEAAPPPILDVTWKVEMLDGQPVLGGPAPSLSIARDLRAGGRGGCNSWFAQAALTDDRLAFSAVAATRMACLSDAANAQEQAFFAALAATRFWRLRDDSLVLVDAAGAELMVLARSRF
jgi:putative lipoprotein